MEMTYQERGVDHIVIVIFTGKTKEQILMEGGSGAWRLNRKKAWKVNYAVVCYNPNSEWSNEALSPNAAFMIGRVSEIVASDRYPDRSIVRFSDYCDINRPDVWQGWRNPIKYMTTKELEIDFEALDFQPMPSQPMPSQPMPAKKTPPTIESPQTSEPEKGAVQPLSIEAAKAGLAAAFGVTPEAIEITIRA